MIPQNGLSDSQPANASTRGREVLPLAGLLVYAGVLWFWGLGRGDFLTTMEAARAIVTRGMVREHSYLVPLLGKDIYLAKPPLFYWSAALTSRAWGQVDETSVRMASAFCAVAALLVIYFSARSVLGPATALAAAMAAATTPLFFEQATMAMVDMMLALGVSVSLFSAFHLVESPRRAWWHGAVCGLGLAVGLMTKGPIILLFFAPTLLLYLGFRKSWRLLKDPRWLIALGVVAALSAPWPILIVRQLGFNDPWNILKQEVWKLRYGTVGESNHEAVWYYLKILPLISFPWILVFPLAFWRGYASGDPEPRRRRLLFARCWSAGGLILFSIICPAKEARYILPLFPAIAVLTGDVLVRGARGALAAGLGRYIRRLTALTVYGMLLAPVAAVAAWLALKLPVSWWLAGVVAVLLAAAGAGVYLHRVRANPWAAAFALMIAMIGVKMFACFGVYPPRNLLHSARGPCAAIRQMVPPGGVLYLYGPTKRQVEYYLDARPLDTYERDRAWYDVPGPLYACMDKDVLKSFQAPKTFEMAELGRVKRLRGELVLVRLSRKR